MLGVCWATSVLVYVNRMSAVALLPGMQEEFALSMAQTGTLLSAIYVPYALVMFPAGLLAARWGLKRSVLAGIAGFTACAGAVALTADYAYLAAVFAVYGTFLGLYMPAGVALISQWFRDRKLGRALGFHETAPPLGMIIGLLVSSAVAESAGWRAPYLFYVLPGAVVFAVFALRVWERDPPGDRRGGMGFGEALRGRGLMVYLLPFTANALCVYGLYAMLPLYLVGVAGLTLAASAAVLSLSRAGGVAGSFLLGHLSDRLGRDGVLVACLAAVGVLTLAFPMVGYGPLGVLLLVAVGFCSLAVYPVTFAVLADRVPQKAWPAANGFFMAFSLLLGGGLGPVAVGVLADLWGFSAAFWVCAMLALAGGAVLLPNLRKEISGR